MALGARFEQILRQFLALGGRLLVMGPPLGVLGAWLAGRAMTGLWFGVAPTNGLVLGAAAAVLGTVACWLASCRRGGRPALRQFTRREGIEAETNCVGTHHCANPDPSGETSETSRNIRAYFAGNLPKRWLILKRVAERKGGGLRLG